MDLPERDLPTELVPCYQLRSRSRRQAVATAHYDLGWLEAQKARLVTAGYYLADDLEIVPA